jgi:hypothetical protein
MASCAGVPRGVYIGFVVISATVEHKITHRSGGGCTPDEVREAFQGRSDAELLRRPGTQPTKVAGFGTTHAGRRLFACFAAIDESDGTWSLMSAWPV